MGVYREKTKNFGGLGSFSTSFFSVYSSSYGMLLPNRNGSESNSYRYGFQGQEMDDEIKDKSGSSYDFGARMYDPRVGRFLSLDAFASKFGYQSPYVFAGNTPIMGVDINGDSLKFYSESGKYLGYSTDNERYKGQNFLVIIKDKNINKFSELYDYKRHSAEIPESRKNNGTGSQYREAIVAGLKDMGTSYKTDNFKDIDELKSLIVKRSGLVANYNESYNKTVIDFLIWHNESTEVAKQASDYEGGGPGYVFGRMEKLEELNQEYHQSEKKTVEIGDVINKIDNDLNSKFGITLNQDVNPRSTLEKLYIDKALYGKESKAQPLETLPKQK